MSFHTPDRGPSGRKHGSQLSDAERALARAAAANRTPAASAVLDVLIEAGDEGLTLRQLRLTASTVLSTSGSLDAALHELRQASAIKESSEMRLDADGRSRRQLVLRLP